MDALPDDLLLLVLCRLPLDARLRTAALCRRTARLARHPSLWRTVSFAGVPRSRRARVTDAVLAQLLQRGGPGALHTLDLQALPQSGGVTPEGVVAALQSEQCAELRVLVAWHTSTPAATQDRLATVWADAACDALGVRQLVALMRGHASDAGVQRYVTATLEDVVSSGAFDDTSAVARTTVSAGALEACLTLLRIHAADATVLQPCLQLLFIVVACTEELRGCDADAVVPALAALRMHIADKDTVVITLRVLCLLSREDMLTGGRSARNAALAREIVSGAQSALRRHPRSDTVRRAVINILCSACQDITAACDHAFAAAVEAAMPLMDDAALGPGQLSLDTLGFCGDLASLLEARLRLVPHERRVPRAPQLLATAVASLSNAEAYTGDGLRINYMSLHGGARLLSALLASGTLAPPQVDACGAVAAVMGFLRAMLREPDDFHDEMPPLMECLLRLLRGADGADAAACAARCAHAHAAGVRPLLAAAARAGLRNQLARLLVAQLLCALLADGWPEAELLAPGGTIDLALAALNAPPCEDEDCDSEFADTLAAGEAELVALCALARHSVACCARIAAGGGMAAALAALDDAAPPAHKQSACALLGQLLRGAAAAAAHAAAAAAAADASARAAAAAALPALTALLRGSCGDADAALAACAALCAAAMAAPRASLAPADVADALAALDVAAASAGDAPLCDAARAAQHSFAGAARSIGAAGAPGAAVGDT
jgi:hypothetical protein